MPLDWGPLGDEKRGHDAQYETDKQKRRDKRRRFDATVVSVRALGFRGVVARITGIQGVKLPVHLIRAAELLGRADFVSRSNDSALELGELLPLFGLSQPRVDDGCQLSALRLAVIETLSELPAWNPVASPS